jgi:hypothetical protein
LACLVPPTSWQSCSRKWRSRARRFTASRSASGTRGHRRPRRRVDRPG